MIKVNYDYCFFNLKFTEGGVETMKKLEIDEANKKLTCVASGQFLDHYKILEDHIPSHSKV